MIICVSPNPAIERTWTVSDLQSEGVFRVQDSLFLASGKGTNVARAARTLKHEPFCAGFIAGHNGHFLAELAEREGLRARWTEVTGETRMAVVIVDPAAPDRDALVINEDGLPVDETGWNSLHEDILHISLKGGNRICFSGSLPKGTPLASYTRLIQTLKAQGHTVWVDCSGMGLKAAFTAQPHGIKVNTHEASELVDLTIHDVESAKEAGLVIQQKGIETVVITLGSAGAIMVDAEHITYVRSPEVQTVSAVGSGDAFLAGLLTGLEEGLSSGETLRRAAAAGAANALTLGGGLFTYADFAAVLPNAHFEIYPAR